MSSRVLGYRTVEPVRVDRWRLARLGVQALDPAWNSIPDHPVPRPRIVHLAGRSHEVRMAELSRLASAHCAAAHRRRHHPRGPSGTDTR